MERLDEYSDEELSLRVMNTENLYQYVVDRAWNMLVALLRLEFRFTPEQLLDLRETYDNYEDDLNEDDVAESRRYD